MRNLRTLSPDEKKKALSYLKARRTESRRYKPYMGESPDTYVQLIMNSIESREKRRSGTEISNDFWL